MIKQKGSAEVIIIAMLGILLICALGFIFWQNFIKTPDSASNGVIDTTSDNTKDDEEIEETGAIVGSLTYPSEGIPPAMEIHATNLATSEDFFTKDHLRGSQYEYGIGYRLTVPAGNYHVYSILSHDATERHYYNNYIDKCNGGDPESCDDAEEKVIVSVKPDEETKDIMVGWSLPCIVPGSEQSTEKFDIPAC